MFSWKGEYFLYIFLSGPDKQYAEVGETKRVGRKTIISRQYLGRVLDMEAGIYRNKERGVFTFDPKTGEYGVPPEDYVPPDIVDRRKKLPSISVDFGDAFFMDTFLHASGMMDVVDQIEYGNPDTLHAMVIFYTLSGLARVDAITWYDGSFTRLLYPKANLTSQRISSFLASIGTPEKQMAFHKAYINFIFNNYNDDKNILIDSSGLPNSIHFPLTQKNVHNGKVSNEIRLIFVVQKSTGLPLYYRTVPGNIVDKTTLSRMISHLQALGIDIDSCIMDAGYESGTNIDLFYDENNKCKIGFITRVGSNNSEFQTMVCEELPDIRSRDNFVQYEDRYLFIKKKPILVGSKKDKPAWLFLGLDWNRFTDENYKLFKRAKKKSLSLDDVYEAIENGGLFGILSGREYECEEILPAYYQRQAAEQIFDFAKNYTNLLPLRVRTEKTFNGHLLLSYIATCTIKMIHLRLKEVNLFLGSRLGCLRNQKCIVYPDRVVTDTPQREANDTYKTFKIKCPETIYRRCGDLIYDPPKAGSLPTLPKKSKKSSDENKQNTGDIEDAKDKCDTNHFTKEQTTKAESTEEKDKSTVKRPRGRPKGSKNKKTLEREAAGVLGGPTAEKRGRGRPKGSKNKKTLEQEQQK